MKKALIIISLVLASFTTVSLADAGIAGFKVYNDSNGNIKIEWRTTFENNVKSFQLQRKTDQTSWVTIHEFQPQGTNSYYSYTDYSAYKTTDVTFVYQLVIVNNDGSTATLSEASINQKVSRVKQTWGSIKAMFR